MPAREEKISGAIVSRTWGEHGKARSGKLVEQSNEQRGSSNLATIRTGYPDGHSASPAEQGRLKSIDGIDFPTKDVTHTGQSSVRVVIRATAGQNPRSISAGRLGFNR